MVDSAYPSNPYSMSPTQDYRSQNAAYYAGEAAKASGQDIFQNPFTQPTQKQDQGMSSAYPQSPITSTSPILRPTSAAPAKASAPITLQPILSSGGSSSITRYTTPVSQQISTSLKTPTQTPLQPAYAGMGTVVTGQGMQRQGFSTSTPESFLNTQITPGTMNYAPTTPMTPFGQNFLTELQAAKSIATKAPALGMSTLNQPTTNIFTQQAYGLIPNTSGFKPNIDMSRFDVTSLTTPKTNLSPTKASTPTNIDLIPIFSAARPDMSMAYTYKPSSEFMPLGIDKPRFWSDPVQIKKELADIQRGITPEMEKRQTDLAVITYKGQQEAAKTVEPIKRLQQINTDFINLQARNDALLTEKSGLDTTDPIAVSKYNSKVDKLVTDFTAASGELDEAKKLSGQLQASTTILGDLKTNQDTALKGIYDLQLGSQDIAEKIRSQDILYTKQKEFAQQIQEVRDEASKGQVSPFAKASAEVANFIGSAGLGAVDVGRGIGEFLVAAPTRAKALTYPEDIINPLVPLARGIYNWRDPDLLAKKYTPGTFYNPEAASGALSTALLATGVGSALSAGEALPAVTATRAAMSTGLKVALGIGGIGLAGASLVGPSAYGLYQTSKATGDIDTQLKQLENLKKNSQIDQAQYDISKDYLQKQKDIYEKTGVTMGNIAGKLGYSTGQLAANIALPIGAASITKALTGSSAIVGNVDVKYRGDRSIYTEGGTPSQYVTKQGTVVPEPSLPRNYEYTITYQTRPKGLLKSGLIDNTLIIKPSEEDSALMSIIKTQNYGGYKYVTTQTQGDTQSVINIFNPQGEITRTLTQKPIEFLPGTVDLKITKLWEEEPIRTTEQLTPSQIRQYVQNIRDIGLQKDVGSLRITGIGKQTGEAAELASATPTRAETFSEYFMTPEGKEVPMSLGKTVEQQPDVMTRLSIGSPEENILKTLMTKQSAYTASGQEIDVQNLPKGLLTETGNPNLPEFSVRGIQTETPYLNLLRAESETGAFTLQYKAPTILDRIRESSAYSTLQELPDTTSKALESIWPTRMLASKRAVSALSIGSMADVAPTDFTGRLSNFIGTRAVTMQVSPQITSPSISPMLKISPISMPAVSTSIPTGILSAISAPAEVGFMPPLGLTGLASLTSGLSMTQLENSLFTNMRTTSLAGQIPALRTSQLSATRAEVTTTPITTPDIVSDVIGKVTGTTANIDTNPIIAEVTPTLSTPFTPLTLSPLVPAAFAGAWPFAGTLGGRGETPEGRPLRAVGGVNINFLRNFFFDKVQSEIPGARKNVMISGLQKSFTVPTSNLDKNLAEAIGGSFYKGIVGNSTPFPKGMIKRRVKAKRRK